MKTYNELYLETRRTLRAAGISGSDLEARLIIMSAAGKTREELLNVNRLYVTDKNTMPAVEDMTRRRLEGEPVAYIVGEWEFYGIPIKVNENVLIPRIDTELLAGEAIRLLKSRGGAGKVLDLCSGSGCIGLAIASNLPGCRVVLVDNSEQAHSLSRMNMINNNLSRNVTPILADVLDLPPAIMSEYDMIVSNPPYIPTRDLESLDVTVRDYEPVNALDGGPDGLYFFRAITTNWVSILKQGGILAFECGVGQAEDAKTIMSDAGFIGIEILKDTQGIDRVVTGIKNLC